MFVRAISATGFRNPSGRVPSATRRHHQRKQLGKVEQDRRDAFSLRTGGGTWRAPMG